jgi:membrane associated rhomboid family serine protease
MLEDRDYMRAPDYGPSRWRTATAVILILNAVIFLIEALAPRLFPSDYLGLSWAGLRHGYVWQLLTFQFLHAGLLHLFLNSLGVFSFGFAVEQLLGMKRFLWLYLISGVIGGLVHVLGGLVWPSHFGVLMDGAGNHFYIPMVGASAGLFGLIAAFALMLPEQELRLLFPPVTVSARVLLLVSLGVSILGVVIDTSNVAHGAHAGGILGGWLMLRFFAWQSRRALYQHEREPEPPPGKAFKSETDFVSKEVDPILEKISRQGIQSLTASERKILDEARRKMEKR